MIMKIKFLTFLEHNKFIIFGTLFICILGLHIYIPAFDNDELEHLHASWLVSQGQKPFTDFVEQHNHLIWYMVSPFISAFNENILFSVVAMRVFDALLLLSSCIVFYKMCRFFYSKTICKWLVVLLCSNVIFVNSMIEFRPDPLMALFLFIGFYYWAKFFKQDLKWLDLALSGLCIGIAVCILQKALVFLVMMIGLIVLLFCGAPYWSFKRFHVFKILNVFFVSAALPIAIFLYWTHKNLNFADYWFWNFTFNHFFYLYADIPQHFPWYKKIGVNFVECFIMWPLGLWGIYLIAKNKNKDFVVMSFILMLTAYFIGYMRNRFPLIQYLIPFFPLLTFSAGETLSKFEIHQPQKLKLNTQIISMIFVECLIILSFYKNHEYQKQGIEFVLQNTQVNETVFLQPPLNPVFRHDSSFFWYNNGPLQNTLVQYHEAKKTQTHWIEADETRWMKNPPRYVRYSPDYEGKFFPKTKTWFQDYVKLDHHDLWVNPKE